MKQIRRRQVLRGIQIKYLNILLDLKTLIEQLCILYNVNHFLKKMLLDLNSSIRVFAINLLSVKNKPIIANCFLL